MKIYNVTVYDIDIFDNKRKGICNKEAIDKIMVYKTIFGVKEIITHQPLIKYDERYFRSQINLSYNEKYGFSLGVNNNSLAYKNIPSLVNLDSYKDNFLNSDFLKYLRNYLDDGLDQEIINERIEDIKRKIK